MMPFEKAMQQARDAMRQAIADPRDYRADLAAGHETTWLTGGVVVGVDPGHGRAPRASWRAWETAPVGVAS